MATKKAKGRKNGDLAAIQFEQETTEGTERVTKAFDVLGSKANDLAVS